MNFLHPLRYVFTLADAWKVGVKEYRREGLLI